MPTTCAYLWATFSPPLKGPFVTDGAIATHFAFAALFTDVAKCLRHILNPHTQIVLTIHTSFGLSTYPK